MTAAADTIECPFCAEVIKVKAKKCRFCGEFLRQEISEETILAEHEERVEEIIETKETGDTSAKAVPPAPAAPEEPAAPAAPEEPAAPAAAAAVAAVATEATAEKSEAGGKTDPLEDLYNKLRQMPDSPEKELVIKTLEELGQESTKGDEAEEGKITDMLKKVTKVLPDVAEITVSTIVNPAGGVMTLIKKVSEMASKKDDKKEEGETSADEASATKEPEENVADVLPDAAKSVIDTVKKVSEATEEKK